MGATRAGGRLGTLAVVAVLAAACGGGAAGETEGPVVVATTSILGEVVSQVVGERGRVEVLIPPGADPHDFQPSAQQAALLREADLVVAAGLGLEEGLTDLLDSASQEGVAVLELAEGVDPIPFSQPHEHSEEEEHADEEGEHGEHSEEEEHAEEGHGAEEEHAEEGEHEHEGLDPHFWQDPVRMAQAVELVAEALAELDTGVPAEEWESAADAYRQQILATHAEIESILAVIPPERRKLVTNHASFGYFAQRYGFEVVGVVIPGGGTLAEPSGRDLAELVEEIEHEAVQAIFVENVNASTLAETVAAELGRPIEVVELYSDSLGEPGSEGDNYLGMLVANAGRIAAALAP